MPFPLAAAIVGGASLLGSGTQVYAQGRMNRKTRDWNEKMYGIQRNDAIADWNMQNVYNSPAAQMQRLKDAGLNPNLVYGNGVEGNSSQQPRNAQVQSWHPETPDYAGMIGNAVSNSLDAYYSVKLKDAQLSNMEAQNTVMQWDAMLKAANIDNVKADTDMSRFGLKKGESLLDTNLDMAKAQLTGALQRNQIMLDANERAAAANSMSLKEAAERILTMRLNRTKVPVEIEHVKQQIENLKTSNQLGQLDVTLKRMGIQPSDNIAVRLLGRLLGSAGDTPPMFTKEYNDKIYDRVKGWIEKAGTYMRYGMPK